MDPTRILSRLPQQPMGGRRAQVTYNVSPIKNPVPKPLQTHSYNVKVLQNYPHHHSIGVHPHALHQSGVSHKSQSRIQSGNRDDSAPVTSQKKSGRLDFPRSFPESTDTGNRSTSQSVITLHEVCRAHETADDTRRLIRSDAVHAAPCQSPPSFVSIYPQSIPQHIPSAYSSTPPTVRFPVELVSQPAQVGTPTYLIPPTSGSPFYSIPSYSAPPAQPHTSVVPPTVVPVGVPSPQPFHPYYGRAYCSPIRRRRVRKREPQNILCIEEMKKFAQKGAKLPLWGSSTACLPYRPRNQYEFYDGPRLVSIDSTENNWNVPPNYPDNLLPARSGPNQNRDADEFGITARDLVPWLSNLMELCCCAEKKPRRAVVRRRGKVQACGPQLETVCLDCGAVLEHHTMPQDSRRNGYHDNYDWSRLGTANPTLTDGRCQLPKYEGYKNWEVGGGGGDSYIMDRSPTPSSRVPLPAFQVGPSRVFRNVPDGLSQRRIADSDYHTLDEVGRVSLPNFPETNTLSNRL